MRREPAVEVTGLSVRFGGVAALDRVDLKVARKELRCLIGPNGAGKSTFFKCLTGQIRPQEGSIRIGGEEVAGWPPHRIARLGVGIKTQVPSVMPGLTVRENIWLGARHGLSSKAADRRAEEVLARLRIGHLGARQVAALAHGQRQLVELGIVLAARPWLILLDEPAAGLTAEEVAAMVELIGELNREAALIIVEHDMHFIRRIAQTVTVFHQGRVLVEAPVAEVMASERVRDVYLGRRP